MSQTFPDPVDQSGERHPTHDQDFKPSLSDSRVRDDTTKKQGHLPFEPFTSLHQVEYPNYQAGPHHRRQGLKFSSKAITLILAISTLSGLVFGTITYFSNQSTPEQQTQADQARANNPTEITSAPPGQLQLTLVIETVVAALLLVGLVAAFLANRAALRSALTANTEAKKFNKVDPKSTQPVTTQPRPIQDQTDSPEAQEAARQPYIHQQNPSQLLVLGPSSDESSHSIKNQDPDTHHLNKVELSSNEAARLNNLYEYDILDTLPEQTFDDLTRLAAQICKTPVALITLVDRDRQWLKSKVGIDVSETPRAVSFCTHAILQPNLFVIEDAQQDNRFADNPLVTSAPNIRFYAGAPLVTPEGYALGTICVIDRVPRKMQPEQAEAMIALARQVVSQLELRRHSTQLVRAVDERQQVEQVLRERQEGYQQNDLHSLDVAERAQLLRETSLRLRRSQDTEDLLKTTVKEVRRALRTDRVIIYALDPTNWDGTVIAESVAPGWPHLLRVKIDDPCFQDRHVELYKNGRIRAINDIHQEPGLTACHIRTLEQFGVKANLVAPVLKNDELLGLLIAHHCSAPRTWQQSEIDLFAQLATQVGFAQDQVSLLEQQEANAERAQLLRETSLRLRQSRDTEDLLKTTVKEVRRALRTDRVIIFALDPADGLGTVVAESVVPGWPQTLKVKIDDPCLRDGYMELFKNGRVCAMNDIHQEPGLNVCYIRTLEQFGVKANLVAPVLKNDELLGLLIAHHCSAPRTWQQSEIDLFAQLATQVGFAQDQVSLLEQMD